MLKIAQQKDEELLANPNPFAIVLLTAKAALLGKKIKKEDRDAFLLKTKIKLARQLLSRTMSKSKIRALMNFLRYYVRFSYPENNIIFDKELANITKRTTTMGIEEFLLDRAKKEGIREAEDKAKQEMLANELQQRKNIARNLRDKGIDLTIIAEATGLSLKQIKAL